MTTSSALTDRGAQRASLITEHAATCTMAVAAGIAWYRNQLDPANQLNYEHLRERCASLARQISQLQEIES